LVTVDTSALIAAVDRQDPNHIRATTFFQGELGPLIVPAGILAEICYFLETRYGPKSLDQFLGNVSDGGFMLDFDDSDVQRVITLVRRYHDLPLGYTDAAVITCAERNGGRVATFDLRHFGVVAREGTIQIVP
jgi:predicted nucleic acid-binding protein